MEDGAWHHDLPWSGAAPVRVTAASSLIPAPGRTGLALRYINVEVLKKASCLMHDLLKLGDVLQ